MYPTIAALAIALATAAPADKVQDRTVVVSSDDAEMNGAIRKAQATLDEFLQVHARPPKGASGFRLKVRVEDAGGGEHLWIDPFEQTASGFSGIVANEPDYLRSVSIGDKITFQREDISDWGYVQDGKQKGSFTVCALFKHMTKEEADRYRQDYGFEC
jgi:uncharacterized protein YegJ (DUF2314 family)